MKVPSDRGCGQTLRTPASFSMVDTNEAFPIKELFVSTLVSYCLRSIFLVVEGLLSSGYLTCGDGIMNNRDLREIRGRSLSHSSLYDIVAGQINR